jgi:hypothetical protein
MSLPDSLVHELNIKSLLIRERYYRDSAQWEKLRQSYHPDADKTRLNISWYGNCAMSRVPQSTYFPANDIATHRFSGTIDGFVAGSQRMVASGTVSSHTIQPAEIEINGDKALAASTGSVAVRAIVDGVEYEMVSLVRFYSRLSFCKTDSKSAWKLLTLEAVYDRDYVIPIDVSARDSTPAIEVPPGARESYKYLDWMLGKRGFAIARDLPGLDDKESVQKVMDEAQTWLQES